MSKPSPFRYFKTSPEINRLAVMLYVRFTIPASVGEFWMVGYLLVFGVRASAIETGVARAA